MLLPLHLLNLLDGSVASAAVTGTASSGLTEAQIVAGGETIIITLTNDTWVAAGAAFNAIRQDIIDGLDSDQSDPNGWNVEVRDKEVVGAVVRTSDTVVTITLTASAGYDTLSDETITVTVPATAVTGGSAITASPTLGVTADAKKGGRVKRQKRYAVEVDGEYFVFNTILEVEGFLAQVRESAQEAADHDVQTPVTPKPPRVSVTLSSGKPTTSKAIKTAVRQTQQTVSQAYARAAERIRKQQAIDAEISNLMHAKLEQEEEDNILMLLL